MHHLGKWDVASVQCEPASRSLTFSLSPENYASPKCSQPRFEVR